MAATSVTNDPRPRVKTQSIYRMARLDRAEISGSLGDLGTFLPLLVGMASQNGLDFATALFFAGVFNCATGCLFAIPMAVQPMKAIAAVALTEGLTAPQIAAAGATVSAIVLALGLTGLIDLVNRLVPRCVVRGLQLALGLLLLTKGLHMVQATGTWWAADSYTSALAAALIVLAGFQSRRWPAALILFAGGLLIVAIHDHQSLTGLGIGISLPRWSPPAWSDFVSALPRAALPQIPLTILNSVIAVCALSIDLFPDRPARPKLVAISVGLMNLIGCGFGAMPMCHGAGGLAGQYRFGARTNGSILFLGTVKLTLAVLFGASLMSLCQSFPGSILGVMLAFSGIELAVVCRDQTSRADAYTMLLTAGVCLGLENIALGFGFGLIVAWCLRLGAVRMHDPPGS